MMEQMNADEIVKALRWLAIVRTKCECTICDCNSCEFSKGFCTDPDSDESIGQQSEWASQAADLIESLQSRLSHYEKAEREGRLVELPCKVGSVVYMRSGCIFSRYASGSYTKCEVVNMRYGKKGNPKMYLRPLTKNAVGTNYHKLIPSSAIGKTVFLTEPEAIKALEGDKP